MSAFDEGWNVLKDFWMGGDSGLAGLYVPPAYKLPDSWKQGDEITADMFEGMPQPWALLKMPIVPGSLLTDGKHPSALFDDPISGERLPLHVRRDANGLTGYILGQEGRERMNESGTPKREDTRSEAYFSQEAANETLHQDDKGNDLPLKDLRELPPQWTSQDTNTDEKYQRRGYATALYDAIANLVNQYPATAARKFDSDKRRMVDTDSFHNERLGCADEQTSDGIAFWRNAAKTGKSKNYKWRVRDDL